MPRPIAALATTALLVISPPAQAQTASGTTTVPCRSITNPQQRLACYDAADQQGMVMLDREEVRRTRRSLFGFPLPRLSLFGSGGGQPDEPEQERIREVRSSITAMRGYQEGMWTFTLADESVWRTTERMRYGEPEIGSPIRIQAGAMGSYLATVGDSYAVRIQRIR